MVSYGGGFESLGTAASNGATTIGRGETANSNGPIVPAQGDTYEALGRE
jgi:hypothetical protein